MRDAMEVESMGDEDEGDPGELALEKTFSNESLEMSLGDIGRSRVLYIPHAHTQIKRDRHIILYILYHIYDIS